MLALRRVALRRRPHHAVRSPRLWIGACCSIAAFLATAGATTLARATECAIPNYSSCINDDTLWPHAGAQHFLTVGGTQTIAAGQVGFGLDTSYLSRPIILHVPTPAPTGTDANAVDNQVNGSFLWSYGVTQRLELDIVLPLTFAQDGTGIAPVSGGSALKSTAIRDLRFGFAYAILPHPRVDSATLATRPARPSVVFRFETSAPTGDNDQFAGEKTAVYIPSLAADYKNGRVFGGLEVGARLRPVQELAGARIGSQVFVGAGVGVDLIRSEGDLSRDLLSITAEARALPTFAEQATLSQSTAGSTSALDGKHITPAEWAVSLRSAPIYGDDLTIQLGGGGSIPLSSGDASITSPRFRFTLSLRYAPLGDDSDGDGILDKYDRCPHENPHQKVTDQGCPKAPEAPAPMFDSITPTVAPASNTPSAPPSTESPTKT